MPYWNSASGFDFDHITVVNMSFCTSLRNFIQIGLPTAEKMTLCRFSSWHISAILDFRGPIMGSLKSQCTTSYRWSIETIALKCLVFKKITFLHFGIKMQDGGISAILDFRSPIMGSWKSPCTTSYRSSIETIALKCLVCEKIAVFALWQQTDKQTDGQLQCTKLLSLSRAAT